MTPLTPSTHTDQIFARRWLWCLIVLQISLWTLIPNWTRHALPMDAAEGVVWGQHLAWGYDRNPWLNAWLTRLAVELGGISDIFIYLFSQLCVALAFWSAWRLGLKMLSPLQALAAVLMLVAIQYYTLAAIDFNDNVLELGLWPLLMLLFYRAITGQRCWDWLGVGLIAGLAMMTKYYTAILLLSMFIFLIWHPVARISFKKSGLYLGVLLFVLLIIPHVIWLFQHDFITVGYALKRVNDQGQVTLWSYIQPGLKFALMQLVAFLGAVGLFGFLLSRKGCSRRSDVVRVREEIAFNKQFLWIVGVGPYLITVLLALIAGWQLHTMWGTPLLSCWGLLLMYYVQPTITRARFYRFLVAVWVVFIALLCGYAWVMLKPGNTNSGNFPARLFAEEITTIWHTHYQEPLPYVVGDRVLCSNITRYSFDKPQAHLQWDTTMNPWIDEQKLRHQGGVFLQKVDEGGDFPGEVRQRFPDLKIERILKVNYVRAGRDSKPMEILVGILPPK